MHYGIVNQDLEPCITLTVLGTNDTTFVADFMIDTGYTAEVILPQNIIDQLNLLRGDDVEITLGDGTTNTYAVYSAYIEWYGQPREVVVMSIGAKPVIGMLLLQGSNISVDAIPNGRVTITGLP